MYLIVYSSIFKYKSKTIEHFEIVLLFITTVDLLADLSGFPYVDYRDLSIRDFFEEPKSFTP